MRCFLLAICLVDSHLQLRGWAAHLFVLILRAGWATTGHVLQLELFHRNLAKNVLYSANLSEIVVLGNISMYQICANVADNVGFKYKETREACYMLLCC